MDQRSGIWGEEMRVGIKSRDGLKKHKIQKQEFRWKNKELGYRNDCLD